MRPRDASPRRVSLTIVGPVFRVVVLFCGVYFHCLALREIDIDAGPIVDM